MNVTEEPKGPFAGFLFSVEVLSMMLEDRHDGPVSMAMCYSFFPLVAIPIIVVFTPLGFMGWLIGLVDKKP